MVEISDNEYKKLQLARQKYENYLEYHRRYYSNNKEKCNKSSMESAKRRRLRLKQKKDIELEEEKTIKVKSQKPKWKPVE